MIDGTLDSSNSELISSKEIVLNGIPSIEIEYNTPKNYNYSTTRFKRITYINGSIIGIEVWPFENTGKSINNKKEKFFNSFKTKENKINNSKEDQPKSNKSTVDFYSIGYILGYGLSFLVFISIIVLVVIYLSRLGKKQNVNVTKTSYDRSVTVRKKK